MYYQSTVANEPGAMWQLVRNGCLLTLVKVISRLKYSKRSRQVWPGKNAE